MTYEGGILKTKKTERKIGKWSAKDNRKSLKDGWGLFEVDDGTLKILKYDEMDKFPCDEDAFEYVTENACRSDICARALYEIAKFNTNREDFGSDDFYDNSKIVNKVIENS